MSNRQNHKSARRPRTQTTTAEEYKTTSVVQDEVEQRDSEKRRAKTIEEMSQAWRGGRKSSPERQQEA
jgi:hypothetical protein